MAYYSINQARTGGASIITQGAALMDNAVLRFKTYRLFRQSLAELRELDARQLADLGMNRSMLESVAWDAAVKKAEH